VKITNSARSGAALSSVGGATANDTATEVRDDTGAADQGWVIVPVETFDPTVNYILVNKNSGTALSVYQGATQNDNQADVYPFINQPDQYWKIVDIGGGYFHFVNGKSGRLLSLTGGATTNGTIAMIYDDVGASDQGWAIQALPTGFYRLSNQRRTTGALSIVGAQTGRESRAQIYDDIGARDQSWSLVPAGNTVIVNALDVQSRPSHYLTGVGIEDVNHEIYGGIYSQMIFGESFQEPAGDGGVSGVSGMWRSVVTGSTTGSFALPTDSPFQGAQYERLTFGGGAGEFGVENRGLHRWGIHFRAGQAYDGYVYARSAASTPLYVAAESSAGTVYAETSVTVSQSGWTRYDFSFTPSTDDPVGRLALKLKSPGTVDLGYVYVEPGPWGRYGGLPVRSDIAEAMVSQKNTVLRYGGSAILVSGYRWKNMVGPRELRPTLAGWWYPYDTNGWGIFEFLSFAESAGVLGIPTLNIDESPADMADFVDYVNGPSTTTWGAKRAADGHPTPFYIHRIELGNEQLIDATFAAKFNALAAAIWAKDKAMALTVGDMSYHDVIANPDQMTGSESGLTTLAPYKTILDFAAAQNGPLAIDLHMWTDTPEQVAEEIDAIYSFDFWVHSYNERVNYALNVYELNANAHNVGRALGNARAIGLLGQHGRRVRVVTSANALQADGENDNGWNQGLVFYDTQRSWLQPPAYVTQMIAGDELPTVVSSTCSNPDFTVTARTDGNVLALEVINMSASAQAPLISLVGYTPVSNTAQVTQLTGSLGDENAASDVNLITPQQSSTLLAVNSGTFAYSFPANSFTIVRLH
jgi:alpha-L-arabinofuranosidase